MHKGTPIQDLGQLIVKQNARKWDIVVPTTALLTFDAKVSDRGIVPTIQFAHNGHGDVQAELTNHAFRQIMSWADIPAKYVDRLKTPTHAALLNENVQHWLNETASKRMLRLYKAEDGGAAIARAFLSDKYKRIDNYDLAEQIMPLIKSRGLVVKSSEITEQRFYLQVVDEALQATIDHARANNLHEVSDVCYAGCVISNSEVGSGSVLIEPMIYRLRCTNGMIVGTGMRRNHVGRAFGGDSDGIEDMLSDDTKKLDDAAFWAKAKDVMLASFDQARFDAAMRKFSDSSKIDLPALGPDVIMDVTQAHLGLNDAERASAFQHLFESGDSTLFGLANAITRTAEDSESYDRAVELERAGWSLLDLNPTDIIKAAEGIAKKK